MYIELIPEAGKFYKTNLHCHTTISDGKQTPEQVKEFFKSRGYSAVCYTDHEVLVGHEDLCDDEFIALHGYEVAIKKDEGGHTGLFMPVYHFNIIAKTQSQRYMPRFYRDNPSCAGDSRRWIHEVGVYDKEGDDYIDHTEYDVNWINEYLAGVKAGGYLITYNHPMWSMQSALDYAGLKSIHAIEVINGACIGINDDTAMHYETILRQGTRIVPVGGDDNHGEAACGLGWTMIKAPELTYEALTDAYEKGYCSASEGPEIHSLVIENGKIKIKTSEAAAITLFSEGRYVRARRSCTETYTEAEFDYTPEKFGKYFRFEVRDAAGYKAFSNAYYTDEIENMQ